MYWNYVYTGTPIALKKKVNEQNFGSGLATRLTVIPLPTTNFEMMSRESTVDYDSDARIKAWAEKLDRMKGELTVQKIVDELYDWTARRMADAAENNSKADEMLLKRCAYHGDFVENGTTKAKYKKTGKVAIKPPFLYRYDAMTL